MTTAPATAAAGARVGRRRRNREAALLLAALLLTVAAHLLVQLARADRLPSGTLSLLGVMAGIYLVAHVAVRRLAPAADPLLLPAAGLLAGIGYAMVSRLDPERSTAQGTWIAIGVVAFCVTLALLRDYRVLDRYRYTALAAGIALLLSPLVPGIGRTVNGSRLWIALGPVSFQPGELAKILLVVFFASYLQEKRELLAIATRRIGPVGVPDLKHFGPILFAWGLSLAVILFEKDLGSSLLIFSIFVGMVYVATSRVAYVLIGFLLFAAGAFFAYQSFGHVRVRVEGWLDALNPATIQGSTYQLAQSLFALAAGGTFGSGLGLGKPTLIPAASTDFVFSAIGEELGLVGTAAVLVLFATLVGAGLRASLRCVDPFGKLLAAGLAIAVGVQTFIIVGGVTQLIPLTGITLPFVSYGGSSVVSNFVVLAVLAAVSDQLENGPRGHGLVRRRALAVGSPEAA